MFFEEQLCQIKFVGIYSKRSIFIKVEISVVTFSKKQKIIAFMTKKQIFHFIYDVKSYFLTFGKREKKGLHFIPNSWKQVYRVAFIIFKNEKQQKKRAMEGTKMKKRCSWDNLQFAYIWVVMKMLDKNFV